MRSLLLGLALVALPFAALPASAECQVLSPEIYPDINYTTVCLMTEHSYGDGTQTFDNDHLAHVSHAVEADPVFDYAYAHADQGTWVYDDGEVFHERESTHIGAGAWEGVRGVVGTGFHANLNQRDQTAPEDAGDACSSFVGQSTCVGAGGWFTVQEVASVGVGLYFQQTGTGDACQERYEVDVDAVVTFIPIVTGPGECTTQMPYLYDEVPFRELMP